MNILEELAWRGIIYQQTDEEGLKELLSKEKNHALLRRRPDCGQFAHRTLVAIFDAASLSNSGAPPDYSRRRSNRHDRRPERKAGRKETAINRNR